MKKFNELIVMKTEYFFDRVNDCTNLEFKHCDIKELTDIHIYEVTTKRSINDRNDIVKLDNILTTVIITDFKSNLKEYKEIFETEIFDTIFDLKYDTIDYIIEEIR